MIKYFLIPLIVLKVKNSDHFDKKKLEMEKKAQIDSFSFV
nr:capsid protein [Leptospira interrogans serovar Copenhageni/Icterohaemorrhagiae]